MELFVPKDEEERIEMLSRFSVESRAESMTLEKQADDWIIVGSMVKILFFSKKKSSGFYSFINIHHCTAYSPKLEIRRELTISEMNELRSMVKTVKEKHSIVS